MKLRMVAVAFSLVALTGCVSDIFEDDDAVEEEREREDVQKTQQPFSFKKGRIAS